MAATFEDWLLAQGLDPKTVGIYRGKVSRVEDLCDEQGWDILDLTPTQVGSIADGFPRSPSSLRQLRTGLKHFWEYHDHAGPIKAIRVPRAPRGRFRGLELDDARLLAKTARGWWPDGTAVLVGLFLALRREEIAKLKWTDFDPDMGWVTVEGKGARIRTIPVHDALRAELGPHMTAFPQVFPGRGRSHVHPATVWNWCCRVSVAAGVALTRPHQLRHTSLATMNDATGDLRTTQEFAGHARPETTAIYTRATAQRLTEAVSRLDFLE